MHGRREPVRAVLRICRIKRQAFVQPLAAGGGFIRQRVEMWPGRFGIDEIRRHRRHTAPIIDAGVDQRRQAARAEIGRRLNVHLGTKDQACGGDGPTEFIEIGLGRIGHAGARLGAEILDDDFLDMAMPVMDVAQGNY